MDENLFPGVANSESGYRLHKLELLNWGTFDSTRGGVHTAHPEGVTTLLIGPNGSGKSTVVDALLTLLVRPVVRNYNVAAGAHKQERDERSYIRGAYGRTSRDEDNRGETQYLRAQDKTYSVILACFCNELGNAFTLAEILYLHTDGSPVKVYCYADGEKSIKHDCGSLEGTDRIRQEMAKRGFRATQTYSEYYGWFSRRTRMRPKAMDMFNQTVAVKDIHSLNQFIREHMLEHKPLRDRIDALQNHFTQLREAHQSLVRLRKQFGLLQPIVDKGAEYRTQEAALLQAERMFDAADSYFRMKTLDLLKPQREQYMMDIESLGDRMAKSHKAIEDANTEIRSLANEIQNAGGGRLRELPYLISSHSETAETKRAKHADFHRLLKAAGVSDQVTSASALTDVHGKLTATRQTLKAKSETLTQERDTRVVSHAQLLDRMSSIRQELQSLADRSGNLPRSYVEVRDSLCQFLRIPLRDLAFAAELIAVRTEDATWRSSIELVLRRFALTLLVPERHYSVVSAYIDCTKISDAAGRGQRLVYIRIGERLLNAVNRPLPHPSSMLKKLQFQEGHLLVPWVRAELEDRFDYRCCETIQEFQTATDLAMTRERHIKMRGSRHEKDDRDLATNPSNFVLGWDNREKKRLLAIEHEELDGKAKPLNVSIVDAEREQRRIQLILQSIELALAIRDFNDIDFATEDQQKRQLEEEQRVLEEGNDTIRVLKSRCHDAEERLKAMNKDRDDIIRRETDLKRSVHDADNKINDAEAILSAREASGVLSVHRESFGPLATRYPCVGIDMRGLDTVEQTAKIQLQKELTDLRKQNDPLRSEITDLMGRYLMSV